MDIVCIDNVGNTHPDFLRSATVHQLHDFIAYKVYIVQEPTPFPTNLLTMTFMSFSCHRDVFHPSSAKFVLITS